MYVFLVYDSVYQDQLDCATLCFLEQLLENGQGEHKFTRQVMLRNKQQKILAEASGTECSGTMLP